MAEILVINDDPQERSLIVDHLVQVGYAVRAAEQSYCVSTDPFESHDLLIVDTEAVRRDIDAIQELLAPSA